VQGADLGQYSFWEDVRAQLQNKLSAFFMSRNLSLIDVVIVVLDGRVFASSGDVMLQVRQGSKMTYYPDAVLAIATSMFKGFLPHNRKIIHVAA